MSMLKAFDLALEKGIRLILALIVLVILILSCLTIVLRWFQIPLIWADPLVRHLVFFTAFLGGALATGARSHIGIDLFMKYLERFDGRRWYKFIQLLIITLSALTCLWLGYHGYRFYQAEALEHKEAFLGLNSGHLALILPVGMGFIFLRFFYLFALAVEHCLKGKA